MGRGRKKKKSTITILTLSEQRLSPNRIQCLRPRHNIRNFPLLGHSCSNNHCNDKQSLALEILHIDSEMPILYIYETYIYLDLPQCGCVNSSSKIQKSKGI